MGTSTNRCPSRFVRTGEIHGASLMGVGGTDLDAACMVDVPIGTKLGPMGIEPTPIPSRIYHVSDSPSGRHLTQFILIQRSDISR